MRIHKLLASEDASKKKAHGNTSKQKIERKRSEEKAKFFKNRFRNGGEENKRRMANNVMRGIRVCDGYLVCLELCVDLPGNGARNSSCYLLSMRWFCLEEERVMQQSSISISFSF